MLFLLILSRAFVLCSFRIFLCALIGRAKGGFVGGIEDKKGRPKDTRTARGGDDVSSAAAVATMEQRDKPDHRRRQNGSYDTPRALFTEVSEAYKRSEGWDKLRIRPLGFRLLSKEERETRGWLGFLLGRESEVGANPKDFERRLDEREDRPN